MMQPDFQEFQRLAKKGNLIPVYDIFPADLLTPVSAYLRIAQGARYSFLLESVEGGEKNRAVYVCRRASGRNLPVREWRVRPRKQGTPGLGRARSHLVPPRAGRALSSREAPQLATAGCRSHRIFQLRHGSLDRASSQAPARRGRPL